MLKWWIGHGKEMEECRIYAKRVWDGRSECECVVSSHCSDVGAGSATVTNYWCLQREDIVVVALNVPTPLKKMPLKLSGGHESQLKWQWAGKNETHNYWGLKWLCAYINILVYIIWNIYTYTIILNEWSKQPEQKTRSEGIEIYEKFVVLSERKTGQAANKKSERWRQMSENYQSTTADT